MKCVLDDNNIIIYIPNKEINLEDSEDIEDYFKELFLKLKNKYEIKVKGFYFIDIYKDEKYGIILEVKPEELDFMEYYDDVIDMKISIHDTSFLYKINDITNIKILNINIDIYEYHSNYYLDIKDLKTLYNILEHVDIEYKNVDYILNNSKKVSC